MSFADGAAAAAASNVGQIASLHLVETATRISDYEVHDWD